jgi:membrane fusion protein (multidrug efflux system)
MKDKKMSTKSVLILMGAVLALIALALPKIGALNGKAGSNGTASPARDQSMAVRMQAIHAEKLGDKILTVGTILPNEEVEIRSEISGKIERIFFQEGGRVKKGEPLVKINDAELQAQFLRAQSRLALAEQQEQRRRQLFEKNLASQEEFNTAVNELNITKAELQLVKTQLAKSEIRAPFEGVIGLRFLSEGSYISPATRITTLQDNNTVKIDFKVPEKYAPAINPGDKINFTMHESARTFTGAIYARDTKIDPVSRTLHVLARSPNPEGVILPGSFANVEVVLQEKEALMIPAEAVIPELKGHRVLLYKNGKAFAQGVEIGMRTDERVEITQGVQAGDTLITSAILQLRPGMAVRPAE